MKASEVIRAWGKILRGLPPSLSIEITKECPLRCPYEPRGYALRSEGSSARRQTAAHSPEAHSRGVAQPRTVPPVQPGVPERRGVTAHRQELTAGQPQTAGVQDG